MSTITLTITLALYISNVTYVNLYLLLTLLELGAL